MGFLHNALFIHNGSINYSIRDFSNNMGEYEMNKFIDIKNLYILKDSIVSFEAIKTPHLTFKKTTKVEYEYTIKIKIIFGGKDLDYTIKMDTESQYNDIIYKLLEL